MGQFNRQQGIPAQSQRTAPAQRPAITQGRLPAAQPAPHQTPPANRGGGQMRQQR